MRINGFIFIVLILTGLSCRKSNYVPPVYPLPPDSLINWTVVGTIPGVYLDDIWFTSASRGFALGDKIYQTMDGGGTWSAVPNTAAKNAFVNLFFVNAQTGFAQGFSQLAETVDGGNSWAIKTLPTDSAFTIFFVNELEGFYGDAGGIGGLRKTMDGGNNWKTIFSDHSVSQCYYPYFLNVDTGFVVTGSGTFASTFDGGQTWKSFPAILPANSYSLTYNQLFFIDINNGFYGCPYGVFKTTDGGKTWVDVNYYGSPINVIKFVDSNTGFYKSLTTIYKTSDGGETWNLNCETGADELIGMYFLDAHNGWACTSKGRILKLQE